MKLGWNGSNHNDRVCHRRFYSLWIGHGCYWFTFILDKKMNCELTSKLMAKSIDNEVLLTVQKVKIEEQKNMIKNLEQECAALRKQLIAATNALMEVKR
jgi:hypothetical protein